MHLPPTYTTDHKLRFLVSCVLALAVSLVVDAVARTLHLYLNIAPAHSFTPRYSSEMSGSDLRLDLLQEILGKKVTLRDPFDLSPEDTILAPELLSGANMEWEQWQTKDDAASQGSNAWNQEPPAKREQQPILHFDQEVPSVRAAHDCSSLRVGEVLSKEITFSPWKTILAYPDNFIGKGNRPRVGLANLNPLSDTSS